MFYGSWTRQILLNQTSVKQTCTIQVSPGTIPFTVSRGTESGPHPSYYACGVKGFNIPVTPPLTSSSFHPGSVTPWTTDLASSRSEIPRPARACPRVFRPGFQECDTGPVPGLQAPTRRESSVGGGRSPRWGRRTQCAASAANDGTARGCRRP